MHSKLCVWVEFATFCLKILVEFWLSKIYSTKKSVSIVVIVDTVLWCEYLCLEKCCTSSNLILVLYLMVLLVSLCHWILKNEAIANLIVCWMPVSMHVYHQDGCFCWKYCWDSRKQSKRGKFFLCFLPKTIQTHRHTHTHIFTQ